MRWEELSEQPCSLARVLAILGDRWTLLVLRDCFLGVRRFDDFERSLGVTRHVLADRLKRLVEAEILAKVPYQERPLREEYRLTEKGMELYPAILSLVNWGDRHLAGVEGPPLEHVHKHCGQHMHGVLVCSECGEPLHARDVTVREGLFWKGACCGAAERSRPGRRRESADKRRWRYGRKDAVVPGSADRSPLFRERTCRAGRDRQSNWCADITRALAS